MKRLLVYALLGLTVMTGCSALGGKPEPPWPAVSEPSRVKDPTPPGRTSTSLWNQGATLTRGYDDHRARRIGDLVTVLVTESSEASRQATTDLGRSSGVDVGVQAFLGMPTHLGLADIYSGGGDFNPKVAASTSNNFKGSGATTRKDSLKTNIAARVMEILDDGNMVIEGRRQVEVNDEIQYLYVRGIARPVDISPNNLIASSALADAQIIYSGTGDVTGEQRPGWLYRLVSAVWPF